MPWYLQPTPSGVTLAQVVPHVLRPEDLDTVLGRVYVESGSPHIAGTYEVTNFEEWYLRIVPGIGIDTDLRCYPWDEWDVCALVASDFTTAADILTPNLVSLGEWTSSSGLTLDGGLKALATIGTLNTSDKIRKGLHAKVQLPDVGDSVSLLLGVDGSNTWGFDYIRTSSSIMAYYSVNSITLATLSVDLGTISGSFWIGAGVDEVDNPTTPTSATTWVLADKWIPMASAPVASTLALEAQIVVKNGAIVEQAAHLSTDVARAVFSVPEYQYGVWDNVESRTRTITSNLDVLSPTILKSPWSLYSDVQALTINGVTASTVTYIDRVDGELIYLNTPVGLDTDIQAQFQIQDFEFVYRGYTDIYGEFHNCDLNWSHPWSPLANADPVYIYSKPSFIKHSTDDRTPPTWRVLPARAHGIIHKSEPTNSQAMQLLAYVGVPTHEAPDLIDLRQPVEQDGILGKWNRDESFEGPAYPEAGVVVVTVPEDLANEARDAVTNIVAAGIIPLVEGV